MAKEKDEHVERIHYAPVVAAAKKSSQVSTALRMVARRLRTLGSCNDVQHGQNIQRVADELESDAKAIEAE